MVGTLLRWLDVLLGLAELILVPASVLYLARAVFRPNREQAFRALTLAGIVALTVAQPFGVEAEPISREEFEAGDPQPAKAEAIHSVEVLGIPVVGFRPYRREVIGLLPSDVADPKWLKLRSWVWPGVLTNGAKVTDMCASSDQACWAPEGEGGFEDGSSRSLRLARAGDEWRYSVLTASGSVPRTPGETGSQGFFRLGLGIVSWPGLVYWIFLVLVAGPVIRSIPRGPVAEAARPSLR
jgi:hypothetical protein